MNYKFLVEDNDHNYFSGKFYSWDEAKDYQRNWVLRMFNKGAGLRCAEIAIEKEFDTKQTTYRVLVRGFIEIKE